MGCAGRTAWWPRRRPSGPLRERLEDVANVVLFLASDERRSCTGADFSCEGGNTAGRIVKGVAGAS